MLSIAAHGYWPTTAGQKRVGTNASANLFALPRTVEHVKPAIWIVFEYLVVLIKAVEPHCRYRIWSTRLGRVRQD